MEHLKSILAVVDRLDPGRKVVLKASVLARQFGARVELFLCDSEQIFAIRHAYDRASAPAALEHCLQLGRRYLESLRTGMAGDLAIDIHVSSVSPLYEAVIQRVHEIAPDLVLKGAQGPYDTTGQALDPNDWLLARSCPVPLMITRGVPWAARPRFAAAVDVSDPGAMKLPRSLVGTARYLARGCHAGLDVIYSEAASDGPQVDTGARSLRQLAVECDLAPDSLRLLHGGVGQTLPACVRHQHYDVLFLGALAREGEVPGLISQLTSQVVDTLDCDMVLMKPPDTEREGWQVTAQAVKAPESDAAVLPVPRH